MLLDLDGFREMVYRRTRSQSSVDAYTKGVRRLEQFAKERLGTDLQGLLDQLRWDSPPMSSECPASPG